MNQNSTMKTEVTGGTGDSGPRRRGGGSDLRAARTVFGLLGHERRGQDPPCAHDGDSGHADLRPATVAQPRSGRLRPAPEIRAHARLPAQNPGYYRGFTVTEFVEYFALLTGGAGRERFTSGSDASPGSGWPTGANTGSAPGNGGGSAGLHSAGIVTSELVLSKTPRPAWTSRSGW